MTNVFPNCGNVLSVKFYHRDRDVSRDQKHNLKHYTDIAENSET